MNILSLIHHIRQTGEIHRLRDGVWLVRGDDVAADQENWDEKDPAKHIVFEPKEIYVVSDDGVVEVADPESLVDLCRE